VRQKLLRKLGHLVSEKTWLMFGIIIVITLVLGFLASKLEMSMNMTNILPEGDPMVKEFNYIFKEFNGASNVFIVVEGEYDDMINFAEDVSPKIKNLGKWIEENDNGKNLKQHNIAKKKVKAGKIEAIDGYFSRIDFKQPVDFIENHGLMLIKPSKLKNIQDIFADPNLLPFLTNLNNSLEKEYIQSEEKLSTMQKQRSAVQFLDGIESFVDHTEEAIYSDEYNNSLGKEAARSMAIGNSYMVSPDRSMLIIMATPNFNIMEMDYVMPATNGLEKFVKTEAKKYDVQAGLAGGVPLARDEMASVSEDSMLLTILALVIVLIIFIVTFRMISAPFFALINLIIGIIWAMGVSWFLVDSLNMMTVMMTVILIGLGIDFSIHIISVYTELVNKGIAPKNAIIETLEKVGTGIITGGLTTSAAFLTLTIARSSGLKEFGLVNGVGLIVIMIATLIILPTILMIREKFRSKINLTQKKNRDISYATVGNIANSFFTKWKISLISLLIITLGFGYMITKVTMDYNYLNMEPKGLESIKLNDKIIDKFNMSADMTMMTAKSLNENYELTKKAKEKSSISFVESISDFLPMKEEQLKRMPKLKLMQNTMKNKSIKSTINEDDWQKIKSELFRLEANVIEMQDMAFMGGQDMVDKKATRLVGTREEPMKGNLTSFISRLESKKIDFKKASLFNLDFAKEYKLLVLHLSNSSQIQIDDLPEIIKDKYISKNGDIYLLTVYPKGNVWNIEYLEIFTKDVFDITRSVSGTPPMFYYLMEIIGKDGRRASLLTIAVVFLFLWFDFKSLKKALIAMVPLFIGIIWMVGTMGIFGIQITLLNIMAIPLIIGIGIDDGVHILHRYKIEGEENTRKVYSSTGKAIIITSLTTMLSFGSLVFATYRGFGSMGLALFIGVGMCLLATILVLPAILGIGFRNKK
jgi:predicted RND superfamily exporter protein